MARLEYVDFTVRIVWADATVDDVEAARAAEAGGFAVERRDGRLATREVVAALSMPEAYASSYARVLSAPDLGPDRVGRSVYGYSVERGRSGSTFGAADDRSGADGSAGPPPGAM